MNPFRAAFFTLLICTPFARAQQGDITRVHDPSIIESHGTYYLFSTGNGLSIRTSPDLIHWKLAGSIFKTVPSWTAPYTRGTYFWAPDISFQNDQYRVYYAVSSFGSTHSAIGLVTNKTLDPTSPDYKWIDQGKVIETPPNNNWNAIDPCAVLDENKNNWLVTGSCWTGIKLLPLDPATGFLATPAAKPLAIASRPSGMLLEEGYIRHHGSFYYLWMSYDHCCRGAASDYRIVVGRSTDIQGPYADRNGTPLLKGGGTQIVANNANLHGPGSCAITQKENADFLIYHVYDANGRGIPTLQIRQLNWDIDGWPSIIEPATKPAEKQIQQ